MDAVFKIQQAGPFISVQDKGRFGFMRFGVTESGPMDRLGFTLANEALGNAEGTPVLEISLGGVALECVEGSVTAAIAGGSFTVLLDGKELAPWSVFTLSAGSRLQIRSGLWGSWCYLAFAGEVNASAWLGSKSVHLNSGLCGMPFVQGDRLTVAKASVLPERDGVILDPAPLKPGKTLRVVMGPQDRFFDAQALADLFSADFKLTAEYNRMGVRLSGPKLMINAALDMPSEPIARGSLQLPGHGDPICLLADHQTSGGYPKIATVISADQDQLAQMRAGDSFRFARLEPRQAVEIARQRNAQVEVLKLQIQENRLSFTQRLWISNLISGAVAD